MQTYDENGNPVKSVPVTTDTLYDLASNTKMYAVNYAIQYMLTRDEIHLDQTIAEILGDGFYEDTIPIAYEGEENIPLSTNREWKKKLSGKPLDEYLRDVFFKPMGLTHITFNPLKNGFAPEDCAATELMGNSRDGNLHYTGIRTEVIRGEVHDPNAWFCLAGTGGHAGLFASASDLARLASVMLTGGYGEYRYFSRDVIDLFTAPKSLEYPAYGLGWWREADHVRDKYFGSAVSSGVFGHQGFTGTLTMIDPDRNLVVVLLTNKIHTQLAMEDRSLNDFRGAFPSPGSGLPCAPVRIGQYGINGSAKGIYRR